MNHQEALLKYCLRLGDNALIRSYRLSEWCSNGPILEEDLALTNFALDMIGRAQALLSYAGQTEGKGRTDDDLAYRRNERSFYNVLLTELPNQDFACTMARELYLSTLEYYVFSDLAKCSDATLAAISAKTLKEVKYHLAHATDWVLRLGDGTEESHDRMQKAVDELWPYTSELFETDAVDAEMVASVGAPDMQLVFARWQKHIADVLKEATLDMPTSMYTQTGGRNGLHSEYMGHILSEMQFLQHAYPDAKW
jgi:ring-1,2-phenylacetyl-CoA epoxidase subunit PaaC